MYLLELAWIAKCKVFKFHDVSLSYKQSGPPDTELFLPQKAIMRFKFLHFFSRQVNTNHCQMTVHITFCGIS